MTFSYGEAQKIRPTRVGFMANRYENFENVLILTLLVVILGALFLLLAGIVETRGRHVQDDQCLVDDLQD